MRSAIAALVLGALAASGATIPRPAPELAINSQNGPVHLSKLKGKVVVVEIMSTTCPHCQNSSKILSKLKNEYGPKGFEALGVAINEDANVPQFIQNFGVNFPVGAGKRDDAFAFLQHSVMTPFYFPQLVFIDRSGNIRAQYGGTDAFVQTNEEKNVRGMIEKLLAEGTAKKPAVPARSRKR
jgi:thiol-disulfide isomerase/thioredoxin